MSATVCSAQEKDAPGTRIKGPVGEGRRSTYSISDALEPFHSLWNGALIHFLSGNGFAELLHNRMVRLQGIEGCNSRLGKKRTVSTL